MSSKCFELKILRLGIGIIKHPVTVLKGKQKRHRDKEKGHEIAFKNPRIPFTV